MGRRSTSLWLAVLSAAAPAGAQSVVALVAEGDAVPGAGTVTSIERAMVRPWGTWMAVVRTDGSEHPEALLQNGAVWKLAGEAAPDWPVPTGRLAGFGALGMDEWGIAHWLADVDLAGTTAGVAQGRYTEFGVSNETGDPVTGAGVGSTWTAFDGLEFYADAGQGHGLLAGTIHDPTWPGGERTLLMLQYLITIAGCCFETPVVLSGEELPGTGRRIERVRTKLGTFACSGNGQRVVWSGDLAGSSLDDGCVVQRLSTGAQAVLAREGAPSPVPGRAWGPLEDVGVDQAAGGHWTLRAALDASDPSDDEVVVRDGVLFAREGEVRSFSAPAPLASLGRGRALLADDGRVVWYAAWSSAAGAVAAVLIEDLPLIVTGTTVVDGRTVVALDDGPLGLAISRDGRYVLARAELDDGREALLRVDLGGMTLYCTAKQNSKGCNPNLAWSGSYPSASAGSGFVVRAWSLIAQVPGLFLYGTNGPQSLPFHGGTLCVAPPLTRLPVGTTGGSSTGCFGALEVDFNAWTATSADPALVPGQTVWLQAWYRDPGFAAPDDIGLTRGLEFFLLP